MSGTAAAACSNQDGAAAIHPPSEASRILAVPPALTLLRLHKPASIHTHSPHPCPAVNNVGTNIRKPCVDITPDDLDWVLTTNLRSAFHLSQLAHPLLKAAGGGASVVFNSSVAGGPLGMFSGTPYAMVRPLPPGHQAPCRRLAARPSARLRVQPE